MASDNSTSFFLDFDDENDDSKYFDQAGGASDDNEVEEDDHVTLSATGEAAEAVRQGETEDKEGGNTCTSTTETALDEAPTISQRNVKLVRGKSANPAKERLKAALMEPVNVAYMVGSTPNLCNTKKARGEHGHFLLPGVARKIPADVDGADAIVQHVAVIGDGFVDLADGNKRFMCMGVFVDCEDLTLPAMALLVAETSLADDWTTESLFGTQMFTLVDVSMLARRGFAQDKDNFELFQRAASMFTRFGEGSDFENLVCWLKDMIPKKNQELPVETINVLSSHEYNEVLHEVMLLVAEFHTQLKKEAGSNAQRGTMTSLFVCIELLVFCSTTLLTTTYCLSFFLPCSGGTGRLAGNCDKTGSHFSHHSRYHHCCGRCGTSCRRVHQTQQSSGQREKADRPGGAYRRGRYASADCSCACCYYTERAATPRRFRCGCGS